VSTIFAGTEVFVDAHTGASTARAPIGADGSPLVNVEWASGHPLTNVECVTARPAIDAAGVRQALFTTVQCHTTTVTGVACEAPFAYFGNLAGQITLTLGVRAASSTSAGAVTTPLSAVPLLPDVASYASTAATSCHGVRGIVSLTSCQDSDLWQ